MRSKTVAVLDIRSAEICAVVGERGVNKTFIVKNKYKCSYEGYAEGELLDVKSFVNAVSDAVRNTLSAAGGIKTFYVGVPGEFLRVVNSDKTLSFSSAKRITKADCKTLVSMSVPNDTEKWRTIKHSCLYYVLSDMRRVIDPVNCISDSIQGKFAFFQCNNTFVGCLMDAFKSFKSVTSVNLLPTVLAEAMYLIEPEKRDGCAVMLDLGYISSTYSVVCGNGIMYSESFSLGIGHVAVYLMTELDIPYEVALNFVSTVNLNAKEKLASKEECIYDGKNYVYSTLDLRDRIREGLDGICEIIEECRRNFSGRNLDGKPLYVTGEGVTVVKGAIEHIAGRLVKNIEVIAPPLPYYDKPGYSSVFSLLDMALNDIN